MGYVNGNLVKSTGATPVFKVDVCSDNSPHCWEGLPIVVKKPVSHKGVVRPWLSLGPSATTISASTIKSPPDPTGNSGPKSPRTNPSIIPS